MVTEETLYYLRSYGTLFLLGIVGATPLLRDACQKLSQRPVAGRVLEVAKILAMVALLVLCTAYLVDGSFNPFLYFRF